MEVLNRAAILALVLAAGACEFVRSPTEVETPRDRLVIHSVLSTGSDTVKVLITLPPLPGSADLTPRPVSGAVVRIEGGGMEMMLAEGPRGFSDCLVPLRGWDGTLPPSASAGAGCYAAVVPGGVLAGARYALQIDVPGREPVRGTTLVPEVPEWIVPTSDPRLPVEWTSGIGISEEFLMRWRGTGALVQLPITTTERVFSGGELTDAHCIAIPVRPDGDPVENDGPLAERDSVRARIRLANCATTQAAPGGGQPVVADSAHVQVMLTVYDSAYATHAASVNASIPEQTASLGLTGAYGVFGSAAIARKRVVLVSGAP